jgi:putative spermidine/putrescine transport system ATP-binding protein
MVTHDQEEALSMADRVAVLSQGRVEQYDTPTEIYDRPASLFVNTFVGTANRLEGIVVAARAGAVEVRLDAGATIGARAPGSKLSAGARCVVCVRPEHLEVGEGADGLAAQVEMGLPLGPTVVHELRAADGIAIKVSEPRRAGTRLLAAGSKVRLRPANPDLATAYAIT